VGKREPAPGGTGSRLPRTAQRVLLLREVCDTLWWVVGPAVAVPACVVLLVTSLPVALAPLLAAVLLQYTLPLALSAGILRRLDLPRWRGLDELSPRDVAWCALLSPAYWCCTGSVRFVACGVCCGRRYAVASSLRQDGAVTRGAGEGVAQVVRCRVRYVRTWIANDRILTLHGGTSGGSSA
jgi:hypothetical protein